MKPKRYGPLVCYLLHFDPPVGRARHYLGSTFETHLGRRLRSHATGKGARLTAAAVNAGSTIALASVWNISTRENEMLAKRAGHLKRRCPICDGTLAFADAPHLQPTELAMSAWQGLGWPGTVVGSEGELPP